MSLTFAKKAPASLARRSLVIAHPASLRSRVGAFLPIVQAKLRIADSGDECEKEANRFAAQVIRMPEEPPAMKGRTGFPQPMYGAHIGGGALCSECQEQLAPSEGDCREKSSAFQRHGVDVPAPVEARLNSLSVGRQLTAAERSFFEPRFGVSFSAIRIHTGPGTSELAGLLQARAFTMGNQIAFGEPYDFRSSGSRLLLAHELAHVVQQGYATSSHQGWGGAESFCPSSSPAAMGEKNDEPTNSQTTLETRAQPAGMRLGKQVQPSKGMVLSRKEDGNGGSAVKGSTPAPLFAIPKTIIEDAPPLPREMQDKVKAYFLITYEKSQFFMYTEEVPGYGISEKDSIQDEMEYLKNRGYLVVYIERATENDIINAFADPLAAFIFTSGHGDPPGIIRTTELEHVEPQEISIPSGSRLSQVILEHCNIGDQYEKWQSLLPENANLTAWTGKTSTRESVIFNTGGWKSDRQWGSLMSRVKSLAELENQEGAIFKITTKREMVEASEEQLCETGKKKVGDVYVLHAATPAQPEELTSAMIGRRGESVLYSQYYFVGDWLADEWEIVEISNTQVIFINFTCGTEETLSLEAGEPGPEATVAIPESNFGPGVVSIYDKGKRVEFAPADRTKPKRTYLLETWRKEGAAPMTVYVLEGGDETPYPPAELEVLLRVRLSGDNRGTPLPKRTLPAEEFVE